MPAIFVMDNRAMRGKPLLQTACEAGFHALSMTDADMALAVLKAIRADLLLIDLSDPQTGGSRLIAEVRRKDDLRLMPILAVGARADGEEFCRLKRHVGIGHVLADGAYSQDDLVNEIRKYIATPLHARSDAAFQLTN